MFAVFSFWKEDRIMYHKHHLAQIQKEHLLNPNLTNRPHNYLCLYVELPNKRRIWYRASPKIEFAVKQHQILAKQTAKKQNKEYKSDLHNILIGRYINVPIVNYFGPNKGVIGVGKILRFSYKYVPSDLTCTRSQFIDQEKLKHLFSAYHYLRHDYSRYSRLNIFVDLYNWRAELVK